METHNAISIYFYQKAKKAARAYQGVHESLLINLACLILAWLAILYIPSMPVYLAFLPFVASFAYGIWVHQGKCILSVSAASIIRQMKTLVEIEIVVVINDKKRLSSSVNYLKQLEQIHQDLSGYS